MLEKEIMAKGESVARAWGHSRCPWRGGVVFDIITARSSTEVP
jgi:hypothetical protein